MEEIETQRLSQVENDIKSLTSSVSSLESDVRSTLKAVDNLSESLSNVHSALSQQSKTNWSTLAAWFAAVVSFVSIIGHLSLKEVNYRLNAERFSNVKQYDLIRSQEEELNTAKKDIAVLKEKVKHLTK